MYNREKGAESTRKLRRTIIMMAKSESIVISAPMSFTGSAQRIFKITKTDNQLLKWILLVPLALLITLTAWSLVLIWYIIFGIWLIPYRLIRRSQRKAKRDQLRHRELLEAVSKNESYK